MRFLKYLTEYIIPSWGGSLRASFAALSGSFFPSQPAYDRTTVNYDLCRQLYRNDGGDTNLGAGFCRPIVDRSVEFMSLPTVDSDDEDRDAELNQCIERYWAPQLVEMFRNAMRDSKTVVRIWQPLTTNPLVSAEEREACSLMLYQPEQVDIKYDPRDPTLMIEMTIVQNIDFPDNQLQPTDPPRGSVRKKKKHEIWEIWTPNRVSYYDKTDGKWLTSWGRRNTLGFIPAVEVWNEFDSALSGGQSDFESVYPFIKAFHEVFRQTLQAHKYHSTPKLKFKVADVLGFLKNNFPDVIDSGTGQIIPNSTIQWKGREVLFLGTEDDIGFIEAKSVLGDSKTLLEFLIDCISIASETPEEMFMRSATGEAATSDKKIIAFEKKIERKRLMFQPYIQRLLKMREVMLGRDPVTVDLIWDEIRTDTVVSLSQALQQTTMSLEVLLDRHLISDDTAREALRNFRLFRRMKKPKQEAADAEDNHVPEIPDLAGPGSQNGNGKVKPVTTGATQ